MYRILLVAALLLAAGPLAAQSVPDWAAAPSSDASAEAEANKGPGPPPPPPPPPGVPVDGGLALLALAGAGYAARRLREQKPE